MHLQLNATCGADAAPEPAQLLILCGTMNSALNLTPLTENVHPSLFFLLEKDIKHGRT